MRLFLRISVIVGTLFVTLSIGAFGYRAWRQHENAVSYAIDVPGGIQEAAFISVGGIDQWISIRGENQANPVILFLHGGPGRSISPLAPVFRPWEKHFTVVMWDQRGAGKTYGRSRHPGARIGRPAAIRIGPRSRDRA